jgi:hypothetical protein
MRQRERGKEKEAKRKRQRERGKEKEAKRKRQRERGRGAGRCETGRHGGVSGLACGAC